MSSRSLLTTLALAVALGGWAQAAAAGEDRPEREFVLRVGRGEHPLDLDQPLEIKGLDAEGLQVVLRRAEKTFVGHGVRFTYPRGLAVSTDEANGCVQIKVQQGWEYFANVRLCPGDQITPERVLELSLRVSQRVGKARGAVFGPVEDCRQTVAGEERLGARLRTVGSEDAQFEEIYTFTLGPWTAAVSFDYRESNRELAWRLFRRLADSLEPADAAAAAEDAIDAEFVLDVGERSYPVDLGAAVTLVDAEGKEIRATLERASVPYADHGLRFEYPTGMTSRSMVMPDRVVIAVEHGTGYAVRLQLFLTRDPTAQKAKRTLEDLAAGARQQAEASGARLGPDETCRTRIAGSTRRGIRMQTPGDPDPQRHDVYAFVFAGGVLTVESLSQASNRTEAEAAFERIASSLRKGR